MIIIREKDNRFYIDESTQSQAGRGLFAARDIKEGEELEVKGVVVEKGSPSDICTAYADAYKFAADYSDSFTRHIIPMGYAALVNHANDEKDKNVEIKYFPRGGENVCVYRFIRDVNSGEEILTDYGAGWRDMVKWSQNINDSSSFEQEEEWKSFLKLGLYKLDKLTGLGG